MLLHAARVLLVEDEFLIAMDVEELCRDNGAVDVRIVANHAELNAELLAGPAIDVAVLDAQVQGKWTTDFARLLQARQIPFIFATGYSDMEGFFKDFPGVPVVGKPYTAHQILEALSAAIAKNGADSLKDHA